MRYNAQDNHSRKNYHRNIDKEHERSKQYYNKNRDVLREKQKAYEKDPIVRKRKNEYRRKRYNSVSKIKINSLIYKRLNYAVKYYNAKKSHRTLEYLGCDLEHLMKHLQQTAINNGYLDFNIYDYDSDIYHIDHILPLNAIYEGTHTLEDICHYSNLQILLSTDNCSKGGVY